MKTDPTQIPIGAEHPDHKGWRRVDASPFFLTFENREGLRVGVSMFAVWRGCAPEVDLSRLIRSCLRETP